MLSMGPKHQRVLNRIVWRSRVKTLLQFGGIVLMCAGAMFVPVSSRGHGPKSTIFDRIVSFGTFGKPAVILICAGATAIAASWLVRGDLYDDPAQ
jgi:hypothetical protein